jgi:hypothetical protein
MLVPMVQMFEKNDFHSQHTPQPVSGRHLSRAWNPCVHARLT